MGVFEFSAWPNFQDRYVAHPGKMHDLTDIEGHSHVPEGGPGVYGRMHVRGVSGHSATNAALNIGERYYTANDSCSLPDLNGTHLINRATGNTYATDGIALPLDAAGLLIPVGVGIWTEWNANMNASLAQPFGLGEHCYQPAHCGELSVATEGNIWAYCETDMEVGDEVWFRTNVPAANLTDGVSLLGGFANAGGADFQQFLGGTVFRPGPAGGAFVLNLNMEA